MSALLDCLLAMDSVLLAIESEYLTAGAIEEICTRNDEQPKVYLAGNTTCSSEVLERLSNDADSTVQRAVARSQKCPEDILERFVAECPYTHVDVAQNPACPPHLLEELSKSKDNAVRALVAEHKATPYEVLLALAKDVSYAVAEEAKYTLRYWVKKKKKKS